MNWLNDQIHLRWQANIQEEHAQNTKFDSILIKALILLVQSQLKITEFFLNPKEWTNIYNRNKQYTVKLFWSMWNNNVAP